MSNSIDLIILIKNTNLVDVLAIFNDQLDNLFIKHIIDANYDRQLAYSIADIELINHLDHHGLTLHSMIIY